MYFEIVGPIGDVQTIAVGGSIRQLSRVRRRYGHGRWRKLKGIRDGSSRGRWAAPSRDPLVRGPWNRTCPAKIKRFVD